MSIRLSCFQLTHPLNFDMKNLIAFKILQFQKIWQTQKKIFPLNRIAPGGPWINVKVLAAAESTASIWLGFNFRDGLMPLVVLSEVDGGRHRKNWVGKKSPLFFCMSLVSLVLEKNERVACFFDFMRLFWFCYTVCFTVAFFMWTKKQCTKIYKKHVQHEPRICWHGKLSTKWSFRNDGKNDAIIKTTQPGARASLTDTNFRSDALRCTSFIKCVSSTAHNLRCRSVPSGIKRFFKLADGAKLIGNRLWTPSFCCFLFFTFRGGSARPWQGHVAMCFLQNAPWNP